MPLFGLSDITFNKGSSVRGPLTPLFSDSEFKTNSLKYPLDLGNYDKSHYLVFYIRAQKKTSYTQGSLENSVLDSKLQKVSQVSSLSSIPKIPNISDKFSSGVLGAINNGLTSLNSVTNGALNSITSSITGTFGGISSQITGTFGQSRASIAGDGEATIKNIDNSIKSITNKSLTSGLKTTTLTKDAIALYMPDTLNYTYSQSYDTLNLGGELLGKALAAGKSMADSALEGERLIDSIKKAAVSGGTSLALTGAQKAAETLGKLTGSSQTAQLAFTAATGAIANPLLEMIYKSPNFRTFQFDFIFYPRDEKEAYEVQKIIEKFRFHQAPEIYKNGTESAGGFLVPPSEFDIKFYYAGQKNPNIPEIATCVLTNIDVNYAPNGFSAYEVPGQNSPTRGGTGMPVSIQMSLQFQETTYLTKEDFSENFVASSEDNPRNRR